MTIADLSIKRPIFITCIVLLLLVLGWLSLKKMPVDLFPNVTFPIVMVSTAYPGAGPVEIETMVSKVLEDEMSTLPGIKTLRSINKEGISTVVAEFTLETDIKYAEQQVRDRIGSAKRKLPLDIKEPVIRRMDPADQPVLILALTAERPPAEIYDLASEVLRPKLEQISQVGLVETIGGRKREVQVLLDQSKLKSHEVSATQVSNRIAAAGQNIPAGTVDERKTQTTFRTLGEFRSVKDIGSTIVNFLGNDVPVTVADVGQVVDGLTDEKTRSFYNGKQSLFLMVFRQSGANTIAVVDAVKKRVEKLNSELKNQSGAPQLAVVRNGAKMIQANVDDVRESILIGMLLTFIVVYFFLGSGRSTFITGLAIPNSLIGAFLLMSIAGFSINVMSLLALSLAVGLLIDDAIVVRENIFRHVEMGKSPIDAARIGTKEVTLAVIATSAAVIAVFGPIGFLKGIVGQFFKEFGLTVCFAMVISLFDALTMAPMLSAYFAGTTQGPRNSNSLWGKTMGRAVAGFDRFQTWLENQYVKTTEFTLRRPLVVVGIAIGIFVASIAIIKKVPKTFMPAQDVGEFSVALEMSPGTNLDTMAELSQQVDTLIRTNKEIATSVMMIGGRAGESNVATFFINLVSRKERSLNTSQMKDHLREQLKKFDYAKPIVKDIDIVGGGMRPFNVNIIGTNLEQIEESANQLFQTLKQHPGLKDVEISSKPGKPEFQVNIDNRRAERLGVSTAVVGAELRTLIEGATPAVFRENGREYDIRVRLKEDQRNLKNSFEKTSVPNINHTLIRLSDIAKPINAVGPATINRQDRGRYVQISADIAPNGPGMGGVMEDIKKIMDTEIKLPAGVRYSFAGQAESFQEMGANMALAAILGTLFVFLVLASLYESFVTPLTIMLVLPMATSGAFWALFITQSSLDIFSMIGCVMLLGIATKNSILLVDYTNQLVKQGVSLSAAVVQAGRIRLRPILMTTITLIAGMLPIAIGLNEASKQRTSMGIAVVGGLISSTILTLLIVPATYSYIERFRLWSRQLLKRWFVPRSDH
jgi:hydrophobic/amphiphilic exporter-1 (mainly G- bacteria), HAE1 family